MSKTVIVVGCGIHYQEKYHAVLEKKGIHIVLLIDLKPMEGTIREFLIKGQIQPENLLFLDESYRNNASVECIETLTKTFDLSKVDAVLLCTEPKARKAYAIWAASHGWDLFMDKPATAFAGLDNVDFFLKDFEEIRSAVDKHKVRAVISCERRAHLGYLWLQKQIDLLQLPLTGIDIHFAGGVRKTQEEYLTDENHPFRYGYGVLLHSGYHYIDLLTRWIGPLCKTSLHVLTSAPFEKFGETDLLMIGQAVHENAPTTNFAVKLFGTSISSRSSEERSLKLQGRVRQEKITLHFGHLCSMHVQSISYKKIAPKQFPFEDFSIKVMHSPALKDKTCLIQLERKDFSELFPELPLTTSMNTFARRWQLEEFLEGRDGNSPLSSHQSTMEMLYKIYTQIILSPYRKDVSAGFDPRYVR